MRRGILLHFIPVCLAAATMWTSPTQTIARCVANACEQNSGWGRCLLPGGIWRTVECMSGSCPEGYACGNCVVWSGDVATDCGCRCYRASGCPTCLPEDP